MDVPEAFAEALWDHVTMDPEELSFQVGDIITVLTMTSCDWWFGQVGDRVGWFPAPFVRVSGVFLRIELRWNKVRVTLLWGNASRPLFSARTESSVLSLEQFSIEFRKKSGIALRFDYLAMWLVQKTRATFSVNQIPNQIQWRPCYSRFPAYLGKDFFISPIYSHESMMKCWIY